MTEKLKNLTVNMALALVVMIVLLILGELGAGILVKKGIGQRHQIYDQAEDLVIPSPNPELSYVFRPYYVNVNSDGDAATNRFGFRD